MRAALIALEECQIELARAKRELDMYRHGGTAGTEDRPETERNVDGSRAADRIAADGEMKESKARPETVVPAMARLTDLSAEAHTFTPLDTLPVYVSPLSEYIEEQRDCEKEGNELKQAKRKARRCLAQLLQRLKQGGGAPKFAPQPPREETDTSRLNRAPCAVALAHRLAGKAATVVAAALGSWASAAFILVKGGAAMRFHFDRVCAKLSPSVATALETDTPMSAAALEPGDFDIEVCIPPEVPQEFRRAVDKAMFRLFRAEPTPDPEFERHCAQFRGGTTEPLYWKHQCDIAPGGKKNKLALYRIQVLAASGRLEFFDLAIPAADNPRLLRAIRLQRKGSSIEYPLGI
ncbi:MAG TPA: hypothetical protein VNI01_10045 [Elusimicrobiota bacterium]|nr:hypothetical protein [Elusimicrobiota bacterium]